MCVGIYEFEQVPEDGEGQGSLACCSPWGGKVRQDRVTKQPTYIYVCVYVCMYEHMYIYIRVYINIYIAIYKPSSKHKLKIYNRYTQKEKRIQT